MKRYIQKFDKIGQDDLASVGGKALNLGLLTRAGFPVPDGFAVTTSAFQSFADTYNLQKLVAEQLYHAPDSEIRSRAAKIRKAIQSRELTPELKQVISATVTEYGEEHFFAVRSSATAEDLEGASFAGQQDTYLNIHGTDAILKAVRDCWASLYTERAILYRRKNSISESDVQMSVVIQEMVNSEISGVLFTADPVTGNRNILSIDASYGLGEALVSGLVTPDIYRYNKRQATIEDIRVSGKKLQILSLPEGGTKQTPVNEEKQNQQVLSSDQIVALSEIALNIENYYGAPQDIEWCLEKGVFRVVQSRNITSLFPLPHPPVKDAALHPFISFNHFQVMTDPISPLGISMLKNILNFDARSGSDREYKIFRTAAGRIYIDISIFLQSPRIGKGLIDFISNVDGLSSLSLHHLISRPDFHKCVKKDKKALFKLLFFLPSVIIKSLFNLLFSNPKNNLPRVRKYMQKRILQMDNVIRSDLPGIKKLQTMKQVLVFTRDFKVLLPALAPGMLGIKLLEKLEKKFTGEIQFTPEIIKGLQGNITTEMGLMIGDMADKVRKSPLLLKEFQADHPATLFFRINQLNGEDDFKKQLSDFMDIYDMRAAGEIDIARERWSENPTPLVTSILSIVNTSKEGEHRKDFETVIAKSESAADDLIHAVKQKRGFLSVSLIKRIIKVVRGYMPAREHPKYLLMKLIIKAKKLLLTEGTHMVQEGLLESKTDIFYLTYRELLDLASSHQPAGSLVARRKSEYQKYRKLSPPRVMTSDGEIIPATYSIDSIPENALPGMPASGGTITGLAMVITDPTSESIQKGEILVAPFTDPGWTPLFLNAAGLVMETGGLLTHGTVVAREYGIPAVVGIVDATTLIKTGDRIMVDGTSGFVQILPRED